MLTYVHLICANKRPTENGTACTWSGSCQSKLVCFTVDKSYIAAPVLNAEGEEFFHSITDSNNGGKNTGRNSSYSISSGVVFVFQKLQDLYKPYPLASFTYEESKKNNITPTKKKGTGCYAAHGWKITQKPVTTSGHMRLFFLWEFQDILFPLFVNRYGRKDFLFLIVQWRKIL